MSVQGIFVYRAFYFGSFDTIKVIVSDDPRSINFFSAWFIAQVHF